MASRSMRVVVRRATNKFSLDLGVMMEFTTAYSSGYLGAALYNVVLIEH